MRKLICIFLTALLLTGCRAKSIPDVSEQLKLIFDNTTQWKQDDFSEYARWYYSVTDFDQNGLLEVLCAITQGTGEFTTGVAFEVSPDGKALLPCQIPCDEGEFLPEIIVDTCEAAYDVENGKYWYFFTDITKNGYAECRTAIVPVCLKDGVYSADALAWCDAIATDGTVNTTYFSPAGPITQAEYDNAIESFRIGMQPFTAHLDWFTFDDLTGDNFTEETADGT